jgi:hypothetical protein
MSRRKTTEQFIQEAQAINGNKYDYSLVMYKNNNSKIEIICNICDKIFEQIPVEHLRKKGCPFCAGKNKNTALFVQQSKEIHGDKYDYNQSIYKNNRTSVKIYCKKCCQYFNQTPNKHIDHKHGCPNCYSNRKRSNEEFIQEAKNIHGDRYNYSLVDYKNCNTKISIICNQCHKVFETTAICHINNSTNCPYCANSKSYSQAAINWLESLKDQYDDIQHAENGGEYKLEGTNLKLDGFSPSWSIAFEYHGAMWHGCAECFPDQNAINPVSKKTYGELFEATKAKKKIIEAAGFRYVAVWDCGHKPNLD